LGKLDAHEARVSGQSVVAFALNFGGAAP
jgi:hypothetical protein